GVGGWGGGGGVGGGGGLGGGRWTGGFAEKAWNGVAGGLLFGRPRQLGIQAIAVLATTVYSAAATFVVLKAVGAVVSLRVNGLEEGLGMDVSQHGETAYADGEGAILILHDSEIGVMPLPSS